ncbi:MAG TPA: DUF4124 domain-containing protein [Steroidobacteraceae bacterium]
MRTALMLLALLAAPAFATQTVWKWVDERGVTHYSDRPVPGAERVEITIGSRADPVPLTRPSPTAPSQQREETVAYRNFEIRRPADQDVIINTGGIVEVALGYEPALRPGHSVALYLDGRLVEDFPPTGRDHVLRDVPRGEHSLIAIILDDATGNRVAETPTVRFYVRQQSIAQPPVGPAVRPPPKPRGQTGNKLPSEQPSYQALHGQRPPIDPRTNLPVKQ